jgi:hypothetical protein
MNRGLLSCLLLAVVVALGVFCRGHLHAVSPQPADGAVDSPASRRATTPAGPIRLGDDSTWKSGTTVQAGTGPVWLRFRFKLPEQREAWTAGGAVAATAPQPVEPPLDGFYLAAVYPFELYWDGKYVGGSGKVGRSRETEGAGPLDNLIALPPHLTTPGEHVVAMRASPRIATTSRPTPLKFCRPWSTWRSSAIARAAARFFPWSGRPRPF